HRYRPTLARHSFPTRRSSDLMPACEWVFRFEVLRTAKARIPLLAGEGWREVPGWSVRRSVAPVNPGLRRSVASRHSFDGAATPRSEEHTSELQSRFDLVCRLL